MHASGSAHGGLRDCRQGASSPGLRCLGRSPLLENQGPPYDVDLRRDSRVYVPCRKIDSRNWKSKRRQSFWRKKVGPNRTLKTPSVPYSARATSSSLSALDSMNRSMLLSSVALPRAVEPKRIAERTAGILANRSWAALTASCNRR